MNAHTPRRRKIAIIGGGVSGAATAWNLVRHGVDAEVLVIEPREGLGYGLAYSTTEPAHRINVPAGKMSLDPDEPAHFMDWLHSAAGPRLDVQAATATGSVFPQRRVFGDYVAHCLGPMLDAGEIVHVRAGVATVARNANGGGYCMQLSNGAVVLADAIVIATSHPVPDLPKQLSHLAQSPRLIPDPYDAARFAGIGPTDRVLIVGTGLTSADVIATLDRRGFQGRIVALSRHGYRSRGHGSVIWPCDADFGRAASDGLLNLVRFIRDRVRSDAARGQTWHAVLDKVRADGPEIWRALDEEGRLRLVRHLRAVWDVHRFRVAPQVEDILDRRIQRGTLTYRAARLVAASDRGDCIEIHSRPRGDTTVHQGRFDWVVVATGPAHGSVLRKNPALASMESAGLIAGDTLGLGLAVENGCLAVGTSGSHSENILVAGPLARGDVGELMGLPEVVEHARRVARCLASQPVDLREL